MKAQVFRGVDRLSYEDIPIPDIAPDEVLVKVELAGLSQSDVRKLRYAYYEPPRIFGEQIVGTIAQVGDRVTAYYPEQRVVVIPHIPCLHCTYCLNDKFSLCKTYENIKTTAGFIPSGGGFAEYIKVPGHIVENGGLIPIPGHVSWSSATFVYAVNCCLKAIKKAQVSAGQKVLVVGAGPSGLILIMLVQYCGARAVATDLLPDRLEKALAVGAEAVFAGNDDDLHTKVNAWSGRLGVDLTLIAAPGEQAFAQGLDCTRPGGKILFSSELPNIGISINTNILQRREVDLMGSHGADYKLQAMATDFVFNQRIHVEQLVSDIYPLDKLPEAIDRLTNPIPGTLKVLIAPG
jgi:L-iditol 2-dehydrogenase